MEIIKKPLWKNTPGCAQEIPTLTAYIPDEKTKDSAIVILPGGGYGMRSDPEGDGYARFFASHGYTAFVCDYRVSPHEFPLPLIDARRAVRTVRHNAEKYGIAKDKIAIMGSSAGGHLATLTSNYMEEFDMENTDEIDKEDFIPNAQILCYPVVKLTEEDKGHVGSGKNLLGESYNERVKEMQTNSLVTEKTPQAFLWHTVADEGVHVSNSLDYAAALKDADVPFEMHIFPDGHHGMGLANFVDNDIFNHVSQWTGSLLKWLKYIGF